MELQPLWVSEVNSVAFVCLKAARDVHQSDPNEWWRDSERGDWMLYYIHGLLELTMPALEDEFMADISKYVRCPTTSFGTLAWNSRDYSDPSQTQHSCL